MALRIKSAKKKHRQSLKKRARNRFVKSSLRTKTKDFLQAIEAKDVSTAGSIFRGLVSAFDKAASKGLIHKKNASKNVARMSRKLHIISQGTTQPATESATPAD
ncbi:MAG: 30S ribosomal protein S20 [Candidatus Mycalebacterium zealandia]|nr:MAG: 30S ribosomal protein S20 [Candidatus Mycalebacterium zealandia]